MKESLIFWVVLGIPMLMVIKWIAVRQRNYHNEWDNKRK